jgi:hypothetical protein
MRKRARVVDRFLDSVDVNLPFDEFEREEIIEELRGHLADCAKALQAAGMDPFDADRAAVERLGPPDRLADELTRARRESSRLLAAAGAGVWGAVRGGVWGGIVGFGTVAAGAFGVATLLNAAVRLLGAHWQGFGAEDGSIPNLVVVGIGLFVAGRVVTPAVGSRAGYSARLVRYVTVPLGAALLAAYSLWVWSGPLSWPAVIVLISLPLWWVVGAWQTRPVRLGFPYRLAMGLLAVVVACAVAGALMGPAYLFAGGSASGADLGFSRIGAPAPAALAKAGLSAGEMSAGNGTVQSYVMLIMDEPDQRLLAGWTDLRIEAWRGMDSRYGGGLDPAETQPFLTAPADWSEAGTLPGGWASWSGGNPWPANAATLSAGLRLDRSPGVTYVWLALTGVAPDGVRHLLSDPTGTQTCFNGSAIDWFEAILSGR